MERSYYAIIPSEIRYDKELTSNAKLLYAEITSLCNEKGFCWATNKYFSELYGSSEQSITNWIKQLENKKYIYIKLETFRYNDGTIKKIRYIFIDKKYYDYHIEKNDNDHTQNFYNDHTQNFYNDHTQNFYNDHTQKNLYYNNIINNNKRNNNIYNNIYNNNENDLDPFAEYENSFDINSNFLD